MKSRLRVLYFAWKRAPWRELLASSERVDFEEIQIWPRQDLGLTLLRKAGRAMASVRRFRPDLLLIESPGVDGLLALVLARVSRVPLVVRLKGDPWLEMQELRHGLPLREKLLRLLNALPVRLVLRGADALLPISERLLQAARARLGAGRRYHVVPIPYRERAGSATPPAGRTLLTVTNFNFWGKVAPLVEAVERSYPELERLELRWVILGGGFYLERCRSRLAPLGDRVELRGFADCGPLYAEGPVMLHVSGLDGLPNVVLEAAAAELAIIVNSGSPAADFISDGDNGLVVDFEAPEQPGRTLERLLRDEPWRRELGAGARRWVLESFSPERVQTELERALMAVAGREG